MWVIRLVCLGLLLACSACGGSALTGGCQIGGLTSAGDPCNAGNQAAGAFSHVPFDGNF